MNHATARRQLAAAQARYDAMEPDDNDAPETDPCPVCGEPMTIEEDCDGERIYAVEVCHTRCECGAHAELTDYDGMRLCAECAADDEYAQAELAAEAMDGDHETALASVYGGEE
jgi:hypothetical protein